MKKNLKVIAFVTFVAVVCISSYVSVTANLSKVSFMDIMLDKVEALADIALPEVVIECGSAEHKGKCWEGDREPFYTPFGFGKTWDCYIFTGSMYTVCIQDAPCL